MEYTKDIIFNIRYDDDTQIVKLKKKGIFKTVATLILENKFILTALLLTTLLVIVDLVFVINFINIASRLH